MAALWRKPEARPAATELPLSAR